MNTLVISIAGPSGSGKTTLAESLKKKWGNQLIIIRADSYYQDRSAMTPEEREKVNYDAPESIDFELMATQIRQLKNGDAIAMPQYDFTTHSRQLKTLTIEPAPIIIIEGILVLAIANIRQLVDYKTYLNTPIDTCLVRRIRRDVVERGRTAASVLNQYEETVRPMLIEHVVRSSEYADQLFEDGGPTGQAFNILSKKIKQSLELLHTTECTMKK